MAFLVCAGWTAAAFLEWTLLSVLHFRSGLPYVLLAGIHIALVVAANGIGSHAAAQVLHRDGYGVSARSGSTAVWFAPLAVYWVAGSIWAVPLAAFVAWKAVILIRSLQRQSAVLCLGSTDPSLPEMFASLAPRSVSQTFWFFCCGLWLESAGVTGVAHVIGPAVLSISAAAVVAAHYAASEGAIRLPPARFSKDASALFTLILALILTTGAIRNTRGRVADTPSGDGSTGAFKGVVLSPDIAKAIQLVAPPRAFDRSGKYRPRVPVRIPFNGVYWYFRFPDIRPPGDAVIAHGSPELLRFRSTDSTPLIMEAHQHFDVPVDLGCCRNLEVEIVKSAADAEAVVLEVLVGDSKASQGPFSLGLQPVPERAGEHRLRFEIPQMAAGAEFDELTIRFRMESSRETESAKIAIRYLVLVP